MRVPRERVTRVPYGSPYHVCIFRWRTHRLPSKHRSPTSRPSHACAHPLRHMILALGWAPKFIIDTGRNGAELQRQTCSGWCNLRGAGLGNVPTMNTGAPDVVDAFFWIKTVQHLLASNALIEGFDRRF